MSCEHVQTQAATTHYAAHASQRNASRAGAVADTHVAPTRRIAPNRDADIASARLAPTTSTAMALGTALHGKALKPPARSEPDRPTGRSAWRYSCPSADSASAFHDTVSSRWDRRVSGLPRSCSVPLKCMRVARIPAADRTAACRLLRFAHSRTHNDNPQKHGRRSSQPSRPRAIWQRFSCDSPLPEVRQYLLKQRACRNTAGRKRAVHHSFMGQT